MCSHVLPFDDTAMPHWAVPFGRMRRGFAIKATVICIWHTLRTCSIQSPLLTAVVSDQWLFRSGGTQLRNVQMTTADVRNTFDVSVAQNH